MSEVNKETENKITQQYYTGCSGKSRNCCYYNDDCMQQVHYYPQTGTTVISGCC